MLKMKLLVITIIYVLTNSSVLGDHFAKYKSRTYYDTIIPEQRLGVRQDVDEQLCELQNNLTTNSMTFIDASWKIPAGILVGNMHHFGHYDQCLSIDETVEGVDIRGKYCMMHVTLTVEESATMLSEEFGGMTTSGLFGVCVPDACPSTPVEFDFIPDINTTSVELECREANDKPLAAQDIVAIVLFSILLLLLVASTSFHLFYKFVYNQDVSKIAKSFSAHHHLTKLTSMPKYVNPLSCINGFRTISTCWVVVGHSYGLVVFRSLENPLAAVEWMNSASATWIASAPLAVDTFFFMAAFLLTWSVLKKFSSPVLFGKAVPLLYLNRYLRLTPLLAAVMLLQVTFFNHVSDGPYWRVVTNAMNQCMDGWWVNMLYLQNYLRPDTMCMEHSWYLAFDLQLFLGAPIVLAFLLGGVTLAICALLLAMLASLSAVLGYFYYSNREDAYSSSNSTLDLFFENVSIRTSQYIVGIVVAYAMFLLKKRNVTISNKPYMVAHWIITAALLILPIYGTYVSNNHDQSRDAEIFFTAWHKPAWALGVGGVTVACMHGFGGPVNWILGHNIWVIPARLSYAMYLIHFPIMFSVSGSATGPGRFTEGLMLIISTSNLTLTIIGALVIYVVVEAPFAELSNLLLAKLSGQKTDEARRLKSKEDAESPPSIDVAKDKQNQ